MLMIVVYCNQLNHICSDIYSGVSNCENIRGENLSVLIEQLALQRATLLPHCSPYEGLLYRGQVDNFD